MKKVFMLIAFLGFTAWVSEVSAQSGHNDNYWAGRARAELRGCIGQSNGNGPPQGEFVTDVYRSICFASGEFISVSFYRIIYGPPCNPTEEDPCHPPLPIAQLIGVVQFGCGGEVVYVECYN